MLEVTEKVAHGKINCKNEIILWVLHSKITLKQKDIQKICQMTKVKIRNTMSSGLLSFLVQEKKSGRNITIQPQT